MQAIRTLTRKRTSVSSGGSKRGSNRVTRRTGRRPTRELFREVQKSPAIGGCVELSRPHSDFLLPPEALLFEPGPEEIFQGGAQDSPGGRQIFLNTPLTEYEVARLAEMHRALEEEALVTEQGDGRFPTYISLHALRLLQFKKFDVPRTIDLMLLHLEERVKRLPIAEKDVLQDLQSGFMYWHGRDRKCRPCLIIRIEHMGPMKADKERAVRLVIFVLEYALRFAMVPGRVENWVVILDLKNASRVVSMFQLASIAATAKLIATTLESVYCGRMVWMKILNMPGVMCKVIESCIPQEKKKKVQFVQDPAKELPAHFQPHQLERRFGGSARDLQPMEAYPFRFFPGASGAPGTTPPPATKSEDDRSLHHLTDRSFHEGKLWDTSTQDAMKATLVESAGASLTPAAAAALTGLAEGQRVRPCRDLAHWMQLVNPAEAKRRQLPLGAVEEPAAGAAASEPEPEDAVEAAAAAYARRAAEVQREGRRIVAL